MLKMIENDLGICPVCGKETLEYEEFQIDDWGGYYPWKCGNCGATGRESYSFEFSGHYHVEKDGELVENVDLVLEREEEE